MKAFLILVAALYVSFTLPEGTGYPSLIKTVKVDKNKITIEPSASFSDPFLQEKTLTYEYDEDTDLSSLDVSIITIPFITNAAAAIWVSGKKFSVETMDKDLYISLQRIREALRLFYPQLAWDGEIIPDKLIENRVPETRKREGIGLLFSGGVDSTGSSFGNIDKKQLLITNYGIDRNFLDQKTWSLIKKQTNKFAEVYGHEAAFIKFNYRSIFKESAIKKYSNQADCSWFHHVAHGLYHLSTPAPLLFLKGYSTLYIGSSFTGDWPYPWGSHPLIDNNLSYCGIRVFHDQNDITRPEKIAVIANATEQKSLPNPSLRVCWNDKNASNCLKCEKCLRTIHATLSEGLDPHDFGLPISSLNMLKKQTKDLLARKVFHLSILWEWRNAQKACQKNLQNQAFRDSHSKELIDYLEWFSVLKLESFLDKHEKHRPDARKKGYYSQLWNKGIDLKKI